MPQFKVTVYELDYTDEKTGKVLYETTIEAKNKVRSINQVWDILKENGIWDQYRHCHFTESVEVL
jgi:phosphopentomutase